jgi:hypothetical protein
MTSSTPTELERLQQLIHRDRQRKLLALLLFSGVAGAAIATQAVWLLALLATGLAGAGAWLRRRAGVSPSGPQAVAGGRSQLPDPAAWNHTLPAGTRGDQ